MSTVEYKNKHAKLYGGLIPKGENENEKDGAPKLDEVSRN